MTDEHGPRTTAAAARLRDADPAASLPRPTPTGSARLLEDTMSHDPTTRPSSSRRPAPAAAARSPGWSPPPRSLLIAGGGAASLRRQRRRLTPRRPDRRAEPADRDRRGHHCWRRRASRRCMVPNARLSAGRRTPSTATVDRDRRRRRHARAHEWYAGEPTDQVEVAGLGRTCGR